MNESQTDKALSVAILGFGHMGQRHARILAARPDVHIAAVCSLPVEEAEAAIQREFGGSIPVYGDFLRMLDAARPDALYVCLPPFAHNGEVVEAARRGIHIFVEKPIALTVEQGSWMDEAVRASGVVSQVGYHMRQGAAVRKLKAMIQDGTAGRPVLFDARYDCNSLHGPWWRDAQKSGGQVFEQVIHLYDMAMHLLGEPAALSGFTANLCHGGVPGYTAEDTSVSAISFRSGALANITGTNCAVPGEWNGGFTAIFENVTAYFRSHNEAEFVYTAENPVRRETVNEDFNVFEAETETFLSAIRGRGPQVASIAEGYTGLKMVDAVLKSSARQGEPVRIDE